MSDPVAHAEAAAGPETPYVGLVPYREEDAAFFFGREAEKRVVAGNLRASRLTILYGASGVGKTSLVEAGLLHALHGQMLASRADPDGRVPFAVCSFRAWRDDPLPALLETIRAAAEEALGGEELPVWQPGDSVTDALSEWTKKVRTLLVVLDQFEDYFLYHPEEEGEGTFAAEFPRIVNEPSLRVHFLLSIREDAWAKLDRFKGTIPKLFANYLRARHLRRDAGREAIEGPIGEWNRRETNGEEPYTIDEKLTKAVLDATAAGQLALGDDGNGARPETARADAVEAPFLQLVMERLWRATVAAGSRDLTLQRLQELGGAQQIVENHLRDALRALTRPEQAVAADVFRYLVTRTKTKIAQSASDLAEWTKRPEPEVSAVLERLCRGESGRVLRAVDAAGEGDATRYELFHDVLGEPILEWRRAYEQRRARRRYVVTGAALLALVAVFASLGAWALLQRNQASHAKSSATSLALASAADNQGGDHLDASLLLGLSAYGMHSSGQTRSSILSALETARSAGVRAILTGDHGVVHNIAFSPVGGTIAVADHDGTVQLWDGRTGDRKTLKTKHGVGSVNDLAFDKGGRLLAAGYQGGSEAGSVVVWEVGSGKEAAYASTPNPTRVTNVAFSPSGTVDFGDAYGVVERLNLKTRSAEGYTPWNIGGWASFEFSPNGRTLADLDANGIVRVLNMEGDGSLTRIAELPNGLRGGRGHPNCKTPAGGPGCAATTNYVHGAAFSPTGARLAAGYNDGTVLLWDVRKNARIGQPLQSHQGTVYAVAFSPSGRTLATGGDGTVFLWDVPPRSRLAESLNGHQGAGRDVDFSPNGATLASSGANGTVLLWKPASGTTKPGGRLVGRDSGRLLRFSKYAHGRLTFSPDGDKLAVGYLDGTVLVWSLPGGTVTRLKAAWDPVTGVSFGRDGRTLVVSYVRPYLNAPYGPDHPPLRVWDVSSPRPPPGTALGLPGAAARSSAYRVAVSPDGSVIAAGYRNGQVQLWNADTLKQGKTFDAGNDAWVNGLAFSPNGKKLAVGYSDGTAVIWDVGTGASNLLKTDSGAINAVAFSRDGSTLATGDPQGTVSLWDTRTLVQIGQRLDPGHGSVESVAFSPDGTLAAATEDGTVVKWRHLLWRDRKDLARQVCGLVSGDLSPAQLDKLAPGLDYRPACAG